MVKIEVEEFKLLEENKYNGKVVDVQNREEPYPYTDLILLIRGTKLRVGYPSTITKESSLGKLFIRFGQELKLGESVDTDFFLNKEVSCFVTQDKVKDKIYNRVTRDTVKPIK